MLGNARAFARRAGLPYLRKPLENLRKPLALRAYRGRRPRGRLLENTKKYGISRAYAWGCPTKEKPLSVGKKSFTTRSPKEGKNY